MADADVLAAHLWDLRAQTEANLRYVTRAQQLLAEYSIGASPTSRARTRQAIIKDVSDLAAFSDSLRALAEATVAVATVLP